MSEWQQPRLSVGDLVFFYTDPSYPRDPQLGFVVEKPGLTSLSILVFSQNTGWHERKSVRHRDDPFWRDDPNANAWSKWGCYELHPITSLMPEMMKMLEDYKKSKARSKKAETVNK